jgi:hypothetical protein
MSLCLVPCCVQAQRDALKQQQELLQQLQHYQHGRQPPTNQPAAAAVQQASLGRHSFAGGVSAYGAVGAVAPTTSTAAATGVGDAVKFSRALTAAEADRRAALKQAAAAQGETWQLRQQLEQQEQELHHLRRCGCDWLTCKLLGSTHAIGHVQSSCWRSVMAGHIKRCIEGAQLAFTWIPGSVQIRSITSCMAQSNCSTCITMRARIHAFGKKA